MNTEATQNLRQEATARGINADRLIFASRMARNEDHLGRQGAADLFLDTLPYNAHTTASDALWAGLPVLTCLGSSFAGRVAGSLLNALGMNELVAQSFEEYEELALQLASAPDTLAAVKRKLRQRRETTPLFDTVRFTRHLEAAYYTMWQRYQSGMKPRGFAVKPIVSSPQS